MTMELEECIKDGFDDSFHAMYEEHPHECNMLIYAGLTLIFAFGAYKEMKAIPRNT